MLTDILSPEKRKIVYAIFAVVGLILGSTVVGFAAAASALPVAVKVALAVYAYLGGAIGATAGANTPSQTHEDAI